MDCLEKSGGNCDVESGVDVIEEVAPPESEDAGGGTGFAGHVNSFVGADDDDAESGRDPYKHVEGVDAGGSECVGEAC